MKVIKEKKMFHYKITLLTLNLIVKVISGLATYLYISSLKQKKKNINLNKALKII